MSDPYLQTWFDRVAAGLAKAQALGSSDPELEGYLASYLLVFISGAYEECVEYLLNVRSRKCGDPEVCSYIESSLDRSFRNPDFSKLVRLLGDFSKAYADELKKRVDSKAISAMESIVTGKNAVAHGKPSTATLREVEDYHRRCAPIFDALEAILL